MTYEKIRESFIYKDGFLYWNIKRKGVQFGKKVGAKMPNGYVNAMLDYKSIGVHRLIYQYHNSDFDINDGSKHNQIDHINCVRDDNRIENLRSLTCQENHFNRKETKGYFFDKTRNNWRASITVGGKSKTIGRYKTEAEAAKAYLDAKSKKHIIKS